MLHHPNIIEYYDSFAHEKSMMIVMEYASGGTLFDLVETRAADQVNFTMWRQISQNIVLVQFEISSSSTTHFQYGAYVLVGLFCWQEEPVL